MRWNVTREQPSIYFIYSKNCDMSCNYSWMVICHKRQPKWFTWCICTFKSCSLDLKIVNFIVPVSAGVVLLCLFSLFCRSLLVHLENGYFGRGFDQFCPQLQHYNTYVDNIYNASKVLGVGTQHSSFHVAITPQRQTYAHLTSCSLHYCNPKH